MQHDEEVLMPAKRSHHTQTVDREWDAAAVEREMPDDEPELFEDVFASADPKANPNNKTDYKFPHHEVTQDGRAGPANVRAAINGIAVLNGGRGGADIPKAERDGVYRHLATHLKDAGMEPAELKK
jgi:hypothetical protein